MDDKLVHIDTVFKQKLQNHTDKQGMHQAWQRMELMLDEDKKRRGAAWLLPLAALLLCAVSASIAYVATTHYDKRHASVAATAAPHPAAASPEHTLDYSTLPPANAKSTDLQKSPSPKVDKPLLSKGQMAKMGKIAKTNMNTHREEADKMPRQAQINTAAPMNRIGISANGLAILPIGDTAMPLLASTDKALPMPQKKKQEAELAAVAQKGNLGLLEDGRIVKAKRTPVKRIEVIVRNSKGKPGKKSVSIEDTLCVSNQVLVHYIPVSKEEIAALQQMNVYLAAGSTTNPGQAFVPLIAKARQEELVASLTKTRTGKRQKTTANTAGAAAVSSAENSFGAAINTILTQNRKFYASLLLAGSTNPAQPEQFGFHLGANLHYLISKKWSLGVGIGYSQHSANYEFIDAQNTYSVQDPIPTAGGYLFNYSISSEANTYKFDRAGMIEVPLFATYTYKKWRLSAGPNFYFSMPVTASSQHLASSKTLQRIQPSNQFDLANSVLQMKPSDMQGRAGFGAMLDVSYNLGDRIGINARYSQMLKSNATTNVSTQISNQLLMQPRAELGIQFYFGREKRIIYLMDRGNR